MDNIHSWLSVEEHHLTEMANLVHYILNVIDGTIIKTSLLKEQRKEKKTKKLLWDQKGIGDNFSKKQTHYDKNTI